MPDKRFEIALPEEVLDGLGWDEQETPYRMREVLVMELLRRHAISQGKAAALLQLNRWNLYDVMGRYQVPAVDMSEAELRRELRQEIPRKA